MYPYELGEEEFRSAYELRWRKWANRKDQEVRELIEECWRLHLIEMEIDAPREQVDFSAITQGDGAPNDQVPYEEKFLSVDGTQVLGNEPSGSPPYRCVFFLHEVNPERAIHTPLGDLKLPAPTAMPDRLRLLVSYEAP